MSIGGSFEKSLAGQQRSWLERKYVLFPLNVVVPFLKSLGSDEPARRRWINVLIFLVWLLTVGFLALHHAMWRDEVRSLTIALAGNDLIEMFKRLHGEGHPAVWYLLLRSAHTVVGRVEVLPVVAFLVALAIVGLLLFRSPFPRVLTAGLVFSKVLWFEYSVMARNYGISVLILFLIAEAYPKRRDSGLVVGALLFLLANTNVIGTLMAGAFLLFWFVDLLEETGARWTRKLGNFAVNASITAAGIAVCALTILPTYNDAAAQDWSKVSPVLSLLNAVLNPGSTSLLALVGRNLNLPGLLISPVLFLVTVGLMPRRAAFISALFGLIVSALFFSLAADGGERHAGVWFFFCITLYWIAWGDIAKALSTNSRRQAVKISTAIGLSGLVVLVSVQDIKGLITVGRFFADKDMVTSRSYDLGRLIASRSDLANATIIAAPDYLVEALPYYIPNRTYLLRNHRFGNLVKFSRAGQLNTSLADILDESRVIKNATGAPVIILLEHRLDEIVPNKSYPEGYNWTFKASDEQIQDFRNNTKLLTRFARAQTDESYDVYLLD
jgi:hypothetical protein